MEFGIHPVQSPTEFHLIWEFAVLLCSDFSVVSMGNVFWVLILFRDLVSTCLPGHDGLRGHSFPCAVGEEAVFLVRKKTFLKWSVRDFGEGSQTTLPVRRDGWSCGAEVGVQRKPGYCNQDPEDRLGGSWWPGRVAGFASMHIAWKGCLPELSHGKRI